jgi:hypothetical protein
MAVVAAPPDAKITLFIFLRSRPAARNAAALVNVVVGDRAAAARPVHHRDQHRHEAPFLQKLDEDARDAVRAAAGSVQRHDLDRLLRFPLRRRRSIGGG